MRSTRLIRATSRVASCRDAHAATRAALDEALDEQAAALLESDERERLSLAAAAQLSGRSERTLARRIKLHKDLASSWLLPDGTYSIPRSEFLECAAFAAPKSRFAAP